LNSIKVFPIEATVNKNPNSIVAAI